MTKPTPPPLSQSSRTSADDSEDVIVDLEFPSAPDAFEAPTGRSSATMRVYASLLASFDHIGDRPRMDLAEIACLFADASPERRERMLTACRWLAE